MKPYGIPRNLNIQYPDVVDIRVYGLKSWYQLGDLMNSQRRGKKQRARRIWKSITRHYHKELCRSELNEYDRYTGEGD